MTDRYALFGNPVRHSKSPVIYRTFAQQTGEDLAYDAIEAPIDGFEAALEQFRLEGGKGGNVTAPFKLEAFDVASEVLERARISGAVNVIRIEGHRVVADDVDGTGLVRDITVNLSFELAGRRVLVLGAGGAARGATLPLLQQKPALLVLVNRSVAKAKSIVDSFDARELAAGSYEDLHSMRFDVVINATSASLRGELPPVPATVFGPETLAYDLAYAKGLSPFLRLARDAGAMRLADGLGMLVEQAAECFAWWRGVRPDTSDLIERLTGPLV
jgi:shikimate dehydrogenase